MRSFSPDDPLIFIHVPKTAGTSVRTVFQKWFPDQLKLHYYNEPKGEMPRRLDLDAPGAAPVIYGHFNRLRGFGISDYYPSVRQFLTILRDPFDMHISRYFFSQRRAEDWKHGSDIGDASLSRHLETGHLNMLEHFPRPVTAENYREQFEEFFIGVGCYETLDSCLQRFEKLLGRPAGTARLPHLNAGKPRPALPEGAYERFRERFPLEFEIYDWARIHSETENRSLLA